MFISLTVSFTTLPPVVLALSTLLAARARVHPEITTMITTVRNDLEQTPLVRARPVCRVFTLDIRSHGSLAVIDLGYSMHPTFAKHISRREVRDCVSDVDDSVARDVVLAQGRLSCRDEDGVARPRLPVGVQAIDIPRRICQKVVRSDER